MHQAELPDGSPVWIVTGYDVVTRLLADPVMSAAKADSTTGFRGQNLPPALDANLLNIDGDQHRRVRKLAAEAFAPPNHPAHRQVVEDAVQELVDALPIEGDIDLMSGLCEPLPPRVIGTLLGLPEDRLDEFRDAARPMFAVDTSQQGAAIQESLGKMLMLVAGVIAEKRADPGTDLISHWLEARDGQDRLSENELISLAFAVIIGGFENVTSLVAAVLDELVRAQNAAARRLLDSEEEFSRLIRDLIGQVAPVNYALRRFPLADLEVNGVTIPRGHTVILSLRSAHLDPAGIGRPDVVFGRGRHFCIGAALAEMQVVTAAKMVLRKYPKLDPIKPQQQYRLRPSWFTYGFAELTMTTTH
ncbi:cytochrome P450 family protein [Nocardia salmonicida]|uniref:cytochrome P450 n=1 Tax=Nocardia salmonicida TaxID=53431 RepID=UPI0012F50316|nr:cytochrome P450 [Nocardia salmonicida]